MKKNPFIILLPRARATIYATTVFCLETQFPTHGCLPPHTQHMPRCTFHCCCSHASQMKAILHSVGHAEGRRGPFVIAKRREKKEKPCQEVDVMSPGND